jgi:fibronectin type 3 domain-containing protein
MNTWWINPKAKANARLIMGSCLGVLACLQNAHGASVTLAWDPNPETDLAGYRVYYGTASRSYSQTNSAGNVTTNVVGGLATGITYYFAVTAYNTSGLESDFSNEVNYTPSLSSNSPPVISLTTLVNSQKETVTPIAGVQLNDPDAGSGNMSMNVSVTRGTLTLGSGVSGGLTAGQIIANGSANVTVTAPLSAINSTLNAPAGFVYTGNLNFVGEDTLRVYVSDNGNSGAGGARSATNTAAILVGGNAMDSWLVSYFSTADLSDAQKEISVWGDNADPDLDGQDNLMEFALGLDPTQQEINLKPVTTGLIDSGGQKYFSLTFRRRKNQPLLNYLPEVSSDKITWNSGVSYVRQVSAFDLNTEIEVVTYQDLVPVTPAAPRFFRLRVVKTTN